MSRVPSVKPLRFLFLFTIIIFFSKSLNCWAFFLEQSQEYRFKADKLQSEEKIEPAIDYYQKAIGLDKYCVAAYNSLAICYEKRNQPARAEEWYLKALGINPEYAPVHYNLGLFYEKYGKMKKAIFHWRQRVRLGRPGEPVRLKARDKLKEYAPEVLQEEDARELDQLIVYQKEKSALEKILGRNKYRTREEEFQDYYLEGMEFFQKGAYRQTKESFQKMIEALPISN